MPPDDYSPAYSPPDDGNEPIYKRAATGMDQLADSVPDPSSVPNNASLMTRIKAIRDQANEFMQKHGLPYPMPTAPAGGPAPPGIGDLGMLFHSNVKGARGFGYGPDARETNYVEDRRGNRGELPISWGGAPISW